jgi:hypothetical protein
VARVPLLAGKAQRHAARDELFAGGGGEQVAHEETAHHLLEVVQQAERLSRRPCTTSASGWPPLSRS